MQNFNFHQHTYRCGHADFDYSDEDYVKESIANNLEAICFTDHAPNSTDKRKNMRMKYEEKEEYLDNIKSLKEKYSDEIEIYTGLEVEYTKDNKKELEAFKDEANLLILGQHFIVEDKKTKIANYEKYTDSDLDKYASTIEDALSLGIFDILAHPDFVMLARDSFGKKEEEMSHRICSAAEKYNVPIEINLNKIFAKTYFDYKNKVLKDYKDPQYYLDKLDEVQYPCKDFFEIAATYNIKVLYGIDTHFKGQISLFEELKFLGDHILGEELIKKLNFCNKEDIIKINKENAKIKTR